MRSTSGALIVAYLVTSGATFVTGCTSQSGSGGKETDASSDQVEDASADQTSDGVILGDGAADQAADAGGDHTVAGDGAIPDATATDAPSEGALLDVSSEGAPMDASPDGTPTDASADGTATDGGGSGGLCSSGCAAGFKPCQWDPGQVRCYSVDDPSWGCTATGCTGGCSLSNAAPKCVVGACAIEECATGYADCNGIASDGCETLLGTTSNCTGCGVSCSVGQECTPQGCATTCSFPDTDCGDAGGCRDISNDPAACGGCSMPCSAGQICSNGQCKTGPCPSGTTMCPAGNCADTNNDPSNCGSSCTVCPYANNGSPPVGLAGAVCVNGTCGIACVPGYTQCGSTCVDEAGDVNNCGGCGNVCASGQICTQGACGTTAAIQLVTGLSQPADIAVDATNVYWTDVGANTVEEVAKAGGTVVTLGTGQATPLRLVYDDTYVYWSSELGGAILRAPKGGGAAPTVVAQTYKPQGLAVDATNVYWYSGMMANASSGFFYSAPKAGGAPALLGTLPTGTFEVYEPVTLVWLGNTLYAFDGTGIYTIATTGGVTTIVNTMSLFNPVAASGEAIYWYDARMQVHCLGTCNPAGIEFAPGNYPYPGEPQPYAGGMAADDCALYWVGQAPGTTGTNYYVYELRLSGWETAVPVTGGAQSAGRLAVDDQYIYWADTTWIGRVAK